MSEETFRNAATAINSAFSQLDKFGMRVDPGHWQGVETAGDPSLVTKEIINLQLNMPIPVDPVVAGDLVKPNLPWAENHFQERVSRDPSNPGFEYRNWPWWRDQQSAFDANTVHDGGEHGTSYFEMKFSHTYQERFWPKQAGYDAIPDQGLPKNRFSRHGIRYEYGDLDSVVALLLKYPDTRQATFPIFFPEDTGAVHGGRIPCTLHYHFLRRGNALNLWYPIRSCDAVRHFRDDVYMAMRLCQWMLNELNFYSDGQFNPWENVRPGTLFFTAYSFHVHMGDYHLLPKV